MKLGWGLVWGLLFSTALAYSDDGVSPEEIVLGQSCALTGPAEELGKRMREGLSACFAKINADGGVKGRKIRLISKDDQYEPEQAIRNTRELLQKEKVFLLIGEIGTPTSQAILPIIEEAKVPFLAPLTGAELLRTPYRPGIINLRASYNQEIERLCQYLVDKKKLKKIACFYQNDGFGQAGLNGLTLALKTREMAIAGSSTYERNTVAVKSGVLKIRESAPDAVLLVGTYKPLAEFVRLSKAVGMKETIYCTISFVGPESFARELGEQGDGCLISQVTPSPGDASLAVAREYAQAMKAHQPGAPEAYQSFEGFLAGKLFCEIAKAAKGDLTRESFIAAVKDQRTFDLGGLETVFSPGSNQGSNRVYLTMVKDKGLQSLGE